MRINPARYIFNIIFLQLLDKVSEQTGTQEQEGILYAHASIWAVKVPQRHFL